MSQYSSDFSEAESGTGSPSARLLDDHSIDDDGGRQASDHRSEVLAETGAEGGNGQAPLGLSVLSDGGVPEVERTPSPILSIHGTV
jgi:hypothetical protein